MYILHMILQLAFFSLRNTFTQNEFAYRNIHFFPLKVFVCKSDRAASFNFVSCLSTEVICQPLKKLGGLPAA